jgi:hypothetical protein
VNLHGLTIFDIVIEIIIFLVLTLIAKFLFNKMKNSSNRYLNPKEFLPEDEVHTLRQVFYLVLMSCFFITIFYSLTFTESDVFYFAIFDIFISLVAVMLLDESKFQNKILWLLIVPYGSLSYVLFGSKIMGWLDLIHIPALIYLVKLAYDKFIEYTRSNSLGITILLLFSIIFISFLITQIVENKNPLDSLVMVSNAFTSNGYAVLGSSIAGKINSIFLVWGGYIISGAGTATLTAAILLRHFNARIKRLEEIIEDGGKD